MGNNYTISDNDACPPCRLIVHRVLGVAQPRGTGEATGIGHTELCRLLNTTGMSTAYRLLQLLDGTFLHGQVSLQPPAGAGAMPISLAYIDIISK